jgi:hypothetical protein
MVGQPDFFDLSDQYAALSAAGDPLGRFASVEDFELLRKPLLFSTSMLRHRHRQWLHAPRLAPPPSIKAGR